MCSQAIGQGNGAHKGEGENMKPESGVNREATDSRVHRMDRFHWQMRLFRESPLHSDTCLLFNSLVNQQQCLQSEQAL